MKFYNVLCSLQSELRIATHHVAFHIEEGCSSLSSQLISPKKSISLIWFVILKKKNNGLVNASSFLDHYIQDWLPWTPFIHCF